MVAQHACGSAGAEPGRDEVIQYTLVSRETPSPHKAEAAPPARWGARWAAAGLGLLLGALLLAIARRQGAQDAGWTPARGALQSKSEVVGWQCHHYNTDLGEMDDWCRTIGTTDGWQFRLAEADGTCEECWCCKRRVDELVVEDSAEGAADGSEEAADGADGAAAAEGSEEDAASDGDDGGGFAPPYVGATLSDQFVSLEDFARQAFPEEVYDWYKRDNPLFDGTDFSEVFDCTDPWPSVYFDNPSEESEPLFRGELPEFPMASEYVDTTGALRPGEGEKQTVIGMVEMQGPYYSFAKDLNPAGPYLVMSMDVWTEALNFQFVQCALRGWPGTDSLAPGEWTIRVVLKNAEHGEWCEGGEAAHARCNLRTSWGYNPEGAVWRSTMREVNTLIQLCRKRYWCEVRKLDIEPQEGKELPQVWLWKTVGERGEGEEESDGEGGGGEDGAQEGGGEEPGGWDEPPADGGDGEPPPDVAPAPAEEAPLGDVAPAPAEEAASEDTIVELTVSEPAVDEGDAGGGLWATNPPGPWIDAAAGVPAVG